MTETNYKKYLNPEIVEAEYSYTRAAEDLAYVLEREQAKCTHEFVIYADMKRLEYLRSMPPIRMCLQCRLEEHAASLYHDGNKQWPKGVLNPTEHTLYIKTTRDQIYHLRVDGSKIRDYQRYED